MTRLPNSLFHSARPGKEAPGSVSSRAKMSVFLVCDGNYHPMYTTQEGYNLLLSFWDVMGNHEYDLLRPLSYPQTNAFLVCFSVADRASFEHVEQKWKPEIEHNSPGSVIILVGTKSDLRSEPATGDIEVDFVSVGEAEQVAERVGAARYREVNARFGDGIPELKEIALRLAGQHSNAELSLSRPRKDATQMVSRCCLM
eukprot:TRINITY_DN13427_c0_g1_i1.p1 TRINITY_DN13427_c0_g1~~TRINITY_DN13427_c0_g1_i1.p1  ORF type:complete len:199 (-),score=14.23 TRINITY_DN13427_c0_g1_i1:224-820(-)